MGARPLAALLMMTAAGCVDPPEPPTTLTKYGKDCEAVLGALPLHWSCQDGVPDGGVGPGAVLSVGLPTGTAPQNATPTTTCDNPPWLSLGGTSGQCIEGARLVKVPVAGHPNTEVRVICRRYNPVTDPVTNKFYQDVAVVASDSATGNTCFFQALSAFHGSDLDGTNVPSPMADSSSANLAERAAGKEANRFWMRPEQLSANALRCSLCHDNDAWMHTPYIDQVADRNAVPKLTADRTTDTFANKNQIGTPDPYQLVDFAMFSAQTWPSPIAIRTAKVKDDNGNVNPQECTGCHRISDNHSNTGQTWIDWTTDVTHVPQFTPRNPATLDATIDKYHYMPADDASSKEADWHKEHDKHVKALKCCAADPTKYGCAQYPILGVAAGSMVMQGMNKMNKCIDDTGDVAMNMSIPNATAKRVASNLRCDAPLDQQLCMNLTVTHTLVDGSMKTITMDENGAPLGYCTPDIMNYRTSYPIFPADVVDLKLSDTLAWDSSHTPLMFQKWAAASGDPKDCPCENPTSTTCHFTSKGASDWFGDNPDSPTFDGDPSAFDCEPQFMPAGMCQEACDSNTHQGGDTPETHQVEMGQTSGTFTFTWEMYTIKDQMIVSYNGTQLYDTGCVSNGGSVPLNYSGTSTKITVVVNPNCEGTTGTAWDFTVGCPM